MDIGNIKKNSDLNFEVAQAKDNALEKMRSRQLMAYNERLFKADADTINLVSTMKQHNKDFFVLDVNDNPDVKLTLLPCLKIIPSSSLSRTSTLSANMLIGVGILFPRFN